MPESPKSLMVGLVQSGFEPDGVKHRANLAAGVAEAAGQGAALVCLQELTLSPYFPTRPGLDGSGYREVLHGGPTHRFAAELAAQHGVHVTTSLYEDAGVGFNTAICVNPAGEICAMTRKQHIPGGPGYHEDEHFQPGDSDYPVYDILGVPTGLPTCYDQWFPELSRIYSLKGAALLIYPTAIGSEPTAPDFDTQPLWEKTIVAQGIMSNTFMVAINRIGTEDGVTFYGSSFISDPLGNILAQAGRKEPAVLTATLDFTARERWAALFPFARQRQPETYGRLTQPNRNEE